MAQVGGLTEILGGAVCIHIEDFTQQQIGIGVRDNRWEKVNHHHRCGTGRVGDGGHQGLYKGTTGRVLVSKIIIIRLGRATSIV